MYSRNKDSPIFSVINNKTKEQINSSIEKKYASSIEHLVDIMYVVVLS